MRTRKEMLRSDLEYIQKKAEQYGVIGGNLTFKFKALEFVITYDHGEWFVDCEDNVEHQLSTTYSSRYSIHELLKQLREDVQDYLDGPDIDRGD